MEAEQDGRANLGEPPEEHGSSEFGPFEPSFALGQLAMTRGVANEIAVETVLEVLQRHACGDWGDLDEEDKRANGSAVQSGDERVLSAYWVQNTQIADGEVRVYVITEADRSRTTVLLTDEY